MSKRKTQYNNPAEFDSDLNTHNNVDDTCKRISEAIIKQLGIDFNATTDRQQRNDIRDDTDKLTSRSTGALRNRSDRHNTADAALSSDVHGAIDSNGIIQNDAKHSDAIGKTNISMSHINAVAKGINNIHDNSPEMSELKNEYSQAADASKQTMQTIHDKLESVRKEEDIKTETPIQYGVRVTSRRNNNNNASWKNIINALIGGE